MLHPGARPVHAISGCPLEDVPLLAQDLILTPQPLQLSGHVFLAVPGRVVDLMLTPAIEPVPQGRQADAEICSNLAPAAAASQGEPHSLVPKLLRKARVGQGDPPASSEALHFFDTAGEWVGAIEEGRRSGCRGLGFRPGGFPCRFTRP